MKITIFSFLAFLFSFTSFATIGPITGPASVCVGSSFTLTDTSAGGVWITTNSSIATIGAGTGVVTGITPGVVMITYTTDTGSVTTMITVNATPDAFTVTGGGSYCAGGGGLHIGLTGSSAGISYQLNMGGMPVSLLVAGTGSPVDFGLQTISNTYAVVATNPVTGCSKNMTGIATITVSPLPAPISGATALCAGTTITLTDGYGAVWNSASPEVASINPGTGLVTGIASGTARITCYTSYSGCFVTVTVTVNAVPSIIGTTTLCAGSTSIFGSYGAGYWESSDPAIASIGAFTGVINGISPGVTTISYSLGVGCSSSKLLSVQSVCAGIPSSGVIAATSSYVCINTLDVLKLVGASADCGIAYQWQQATDGVTFTNISGATDTVYDAYPAATQYYRCKVTCMNTGLYAYTAPQYIFVHNQIATHDVLNIADTFCNIPDFHITTCGSSPASNVTTWFGDGSFANMPFTTAGYSSADFLHTYKQPGTYRIKQVLYNGTTPEDSIAYSYEYAYCRNLPVKFYFDTNNNCVYDSSEQLLTLAVITEVDSAGIPVDTISSTSGFYYKAFGGIGTVYSFRVILLPPGVAVSCPASVLYDTIQSSYSNAQSKYIGLDCGTIAGFDLAEHVSTTTGQHRQLGTIVINNTACFTDSITVTLRFSPKFYFANASPEPSSIVGNVATWRFNTSELADDSSIYYWLELPSGLPFLLLGDTVNSVFTTVGSLNGDVNTSNNVIVKSDTVEASLDPNDISVLPTGYVLPCAPLQYTIGFENTGNDTAHNIYIMDTLSDKLDAHSLNIEVASAIMNFVLISDGGYTIAKFDFPAINLIDSNHSGKPSGMVAFNIKTKQGLTDNTPIENHAGIFFDDNPVVLTNVVQNIIGISAISGAGTVCIAGQDTLYSPDKGGVWSTSNIKAAVLNGIVIGATTGQDTISYTMSSTCATKTTSKVIVIHTVPDGGVITGTNFVCVGSAISLSDTVVGGLWSIADTTVAAVVTTGVVSGIVADTVTVSYTMANTCGASVVTKVITVNALPAAISGSAALCAGAVSALVDTSVGGLWSSGDVATASVAPASGLVTGASAGSAVITYTLSTGCYSNYNITINPLPARYHVTGGGDYCMGGIGVAIGLDNSVAGNKYRLYHDSTLVASMPGTGSAVGFGPEPVAGTYKVTATDTITGCVNNMQDSAMVDITPTVAPMVSISGNPGDTLCTGVKVIFAAMAVNGGAAPTYAWNVNGVAAGTGSSFGYMPVNGDMVTAVLRSNAHCASPDTVSASVMMDIEIPLLPTVLISANPAANIAHGQAVTFTASVDGTFAPEYQWMVNATYIAGATQATFTSNTLNDHDTVICLASVKNNCGTTIMPGSMVMAVSSVGVIQTGSDDGMLAVYPNPNDGIFTLRLSSAIDEEVHVTITNVTGEKVKEITTATNMQSNIKLDVPEGVYFLSAITAQGQYTVKLIVAH